MNYHGGFPSKLAKRTPSWSEVSVGAQGKPWVLCFRGVWVQCGKGWNTPGAAGPPSAVPAHQVSLMMAPLVHGTVVCKEHSLLLPHTELRACGAWSINDCGHYQYMQMRLGIFSGQMDPWRDASFYFTDSAKSWFSHTHPSSTQAWGE